MLKDKNYSYNPPAEDDQTTGAGYTLLQVLLFSERKIV
jgi:hypothetical protein